MAVKATEKEFKSIIFLLVLLLTSCNYQKHFIKNKSSQNLPPTVDYTDSTVTVAAGNYKAVPVKKIFYGGHYRQAWRAPVSVPVIDIWKLGLKPYKRGGNMQSIVLHLQDEHGKKFVLRSIQKNQIKAVPEGLRKTFVVNIVQDQVSSMHPYGAFAVPYLAEAVKVFHTDPKLVLIPDDPRLGEYRETFGGMLALFEEKPEGDMSDLKNFGYSKNVIGTPELLEKLMESSNNRVNEKTFLKARLLDIFLGDWDRSEDQWAWAEFKNGNKTVYEPIPRDRDQVFVNMDGLFPWLYSRRWSVRKIQGFKDDIPDMVGLNMNAKHIDRQLLSGLSLNDWLSIADSMKIRLSDAVIENAFKIWPDTVYKIDGKNIIAKLKKRRDKLSHYAETYYKILAKEVDVTGSSDPEKFIVERSGDTFTLVKIYRLKDDSSRLIYQRKFEIKETREIHLYGLGGDDVFDVTGKANAGILIRIIGGDGKDTVTDRSFVKGLRTKTKVYDLKEQTSLHRSEETKDLTSYDIRINNYDREAFDYDKVSPKIVFEYHPDDGILIGGGFGYKHFGFGKKPYSYYQKMTVTGSVKTSSTYFKYTGDFIRLLRKWDLNFDMTASPYAAASFYGFGNETKKTSPDKDHYLVRINEVNIFPAFKRSDTPNLVFKLGPEYRYFRVRKTPGTFIDSEKTGLPDITFKPKHYLGPRLELVYLKANEDVFPTKGFKWEASGSWIFSLDANSNSYSNIGSNLSFYIPLPLPLVSTIALRTGAGSSFDAFEFFQSNTLGGYSFHTGEENLRGYGRSRFAGRSVLFQNAELRAKIISFERFGDIGILLFDDVGRVWRDSEISKKWHNGYGGGIWLVPFNKVVFTITLSYSEEDKPVDIHMGFLF